MKRIILWIAFCFFTCYCYSQSSVVNQIREINPPAVALSPLRFLASDELMGRRATRPEINIAARYISESFKSSGLKELVGTKDYFQAFPIIVINRSSQGGFTVAGTTYKMTESLLVGRGRDTAITAPVIYVKHGLADDLNDLDVNGKIVITEFGENDSSSAQQAFAALFAKKVVPLQQKGAVAIIERFKSKEIPWSELQHENRSEVVLINDVPPTPGIPVLLVNDTFDVLKQLPQKNEGTLTIKGFRKRILVQKNVIGWVEGTDPTLKDQYLVLSAHYDHLGVADAPRVEEGKLDSIYNGARDNAIGTTAIIDAARYFAHYPARRSILFIAFAAEEVGEMGSKYFVSHPVVPLRKLVFNLNVDNMSYNDTTIITVVGIERTTADKNIRQATAALGLRTIPDPVPEQHSFERSDNFSFAVNGIPASSFELGMKSYDSTITNRYHQLSDEVGNLNLNYAAKYIYSFILAARNIANNPAPPAWSKGDQYEAAGKALYK